MNVHAQYQFGLHTGLGRVMQKCLQIFQHSELPLPTFAQLGQLHCRFLVPPQDDGSRTEPVKEVSLSVSFYPHLLFVALSPINGGASYSFLAASYLPLGSPLYHSEPAHRFLPKQFDFHPKIIHRNRSPRSTGEWRSTKSAHLHLPRATSP